MNLKSLFPRPIFQGFGPNALIEESSPLFTVNAKRPWRLRDKVRQLCPRQPGVYGMVDGSGELVYVGKAKCLRTRLLSYFRPKSRDPKAGRIVRDAQTIAWEPALSEFGALLRELELICRFQPHHNVHGQPKRRRRVYLCLGGRSAAHVCVASKPPKKAVDVFGPVSGAMRAREAARRLNDLFELADCPKPQVMHFADQNELFPVVRAAGCIRHEIGNCVGPCAGACSRADYADRIEAARRFLNGADLTPLVAIQREMASASAAMSFERAAGLRDKLKTLTWLTEHLARLRQASAESFVYPVTGWNGNELWYLVRAGRVRSVIAAPVDGRTRRTAHTHLETVYGSKDALPGPVTLEEIDGVLLVAAWFRRHPAEWARVWDPADVGRKEEIA